MSHLQRLVDSLAAGSGSSAAAAADGRPSTRPRTAPAAGATGQVAAFGPQLDLSRLDALSPSQLQRYASAPRALLASSVTLLTRRLSRAPLLLPCCCLKQNFEACAQSAFVWVEDFSLSCSGQVANCSAHHLLSCRLCAALKPAFGEHAPPMERMAGSDLREMLQLPGLAAHPAVARALAASLDAGPAWPQVPPRLYLQSFCLLRCINSRKHHVDLHMQGGIALCVLIP